MSSSDSDDSEQAFCFFGTPLDSLDEDEIPRKKPIAVEEQIATDSHGRRRFHGAFTGGFSAGFFNTVGSLEGWTPNDFKSSRTEKAQIMVQKPADFMDDEDIGEFGIAPQTIKATKDYSTAVKRKRHLARGPIPGEPVLDTLISGKNETIGYLLLKNIGIQDKIVLKNHELGLNPAKVYGCEMPSRCEISVDIQKKLYNMPKIYVDCLANPKNNTFGIGYKGLDRSVNVLSSTSLLVKEKNKNVHITGQAFGVGAFEEEDDDIYSKDDISNYDFVLTREKTNGKNIGGSNSDLHFNIFRKNKKQLLCKKQFPTIIIPSSFSGKHRVRISRFESVKANLNSTCEKQKFNSAVRATYLDKPDEKASTSSHEEFKNIKINDATADKDQIQSLLSLDRFVSASQKEEINNILEQPKTLYYNVSQQMQDAARMKMFGPLTRTISDWHPHARLCERFNVPEPFIDRPDLKPNKRRKNLIFEQSRFNEESSISKAGISEENIKSVAGSDNKVNTDSTAVPQTNIDDHGEANEKIYRNKIEENKVMKSETAQHTGEPREEVKEKSDIQFDIVSNKIDVESKDITEKINIAEKIDLFKAVFFSSDESGEEIDQEEVSSKDNSDLVMTILSEPLIPIVKNTKQGILSNLSFNMSGECSTNTVRIGEKCTAKNEVKTIVSAPLYGPCLPVEHSKGNVTNIHISSDSSDEWIEKDDATHKKKHKYTKKMKRKKHKKHKKHTC